MKGILTTLKLESERRIARKAHHVICIEGDPGVGKSWIGGLYGCIMNPDFDVRRQVNYTVLDGIACCRDPRASPPGTVIIFDEAIKGANKKKTMHGIGLEVEDLLNTVRKFRQIIIFIIPDFRSLNGSVQALCHHVLQVTGWGQGKLWRTAVINHGPDYKTVTRQPVIEGPLPNWMEHFPTQASEYERLALERATERPSEQSLEPIRRQARLVIEHVLRPAQLRP